MFSKVKKLLGIGKEEKPKSIFEERSPDKAQFIKYEPVDKLDRIIENLNADN